jgi:pyrimidine operon attenuation protein/uracil phosphoribosyltransferase
MTKRLILDSTQVTRKLQRMALQIMEKNAGKPIILVGVAQSGIAIAETIAANMVHFGAPSPQVYTISLNKQNPLDTAMQSSALEAQIRGAALVLVDDVQNSGKTLLHVIHHFIPMQPDSIQTAVLVNRGHSRFPVHTDFVGLSLSTTLQEHVSVELEAQGTAVYLC